MGAYDFNLFRLTQTSPLTSHGYLARVQRNVCHFAWNILTSELLISDECSVSDTGNRFVVTHRDVEFYCVLQPPVLCSCDFKMQFDLPCAHALACYKFTSTNVGIDEVASRWRISSSEMHAPESGPLPPIPAMSASPTPLWDMIQQAQRTHGHDVVLTAVTQAISSLERYNVPDPDVKSRGRPTASTCQITCGKCKKKGHNSRTCSVKLK